MNVKFLILRIIGSLLLAFISYVAGCIAALIVTFSESHIYSLVAWASLALPSILIPQIWIPKGKRKKALIGSAIFIGILIAVTSTECLYRAHEKSITIDTTPNIKVGEYLPFSEDTKIVRYENATLHLTDNLPKIDGAAAVFPVYSAFVHATYPEGTKLNTRYTLEAGDPSVFFYSNTVNGYERLAEKKIDIFFGAYPSEEQIAYTKENGTTFRYVPIGYEAFVFFVNKKNTVTNLTQEQIRAIYSGDITNWSQVGGDNKPIVAYQRNEGSGSQSMLKRIMGDTPITDPPTEQVQSLMEGIIDVVADYKNNRNSIGFSFRYYLESIISNPNVKMLSVDGVYPSPENIKNGTYAFVTPLYAVTYNECTNENVNLFLDWILSDEGQQIIEETGYIGIR